MANPNAKEQYMLELINRIRTNPEAEYDLLVDSSNEDIKSALSYFNVNLDVLKSQWNQLQASQPVAWSNKLHESAVTHSKLMIEEDKQSHNLPNEPKLGDRIRNTGYEFTTIAENIYAYGSSVFESHAAFAIDWGNSTNGIQSPPAHRNAIMSNRFREVGIGILPENNSSTKVGSVVTTQHFANSKNLTANDRSWLLGTAFRDVDNNDFYSIGEGLDNIILNISGISNPDFSTSIATQDAGGYQTLLSPGEYQVEFIRDNKNIKTEKVTVNDENVKLDLMIDGKTYQLDDGKRDAHYNPGSGDAIVFNAYTADAKYQTIDFISVGLSNLGNPSKVFLYQDRDNDRQPDSDEKILEIDTNILDKEDFAHIPIQPTKVENTFFVGALYGSQNNNPTWVPVDNDSSAQQSWIAANKAGNLDLNNFSTSLLTGKNWLLRASSSDSTISEQPISPGISVNSGKSEPIGTNLQKSNNIELIDLTNQISTVKASVEVTRDADYDNLIGFYAVNNASGGIEVNDEIINPGDSRYKQAALENRITSLELLHTDKRGEFNGTFAGGTIFAPFIIADGDLSDALSNNAEVYFAYQGANSDNFDHIRLIDDNKFGFEDLAGGGDKDYNDLIVTIDFTV
ncbi:uncharacterized protein with SCP/PR1 domains [Rivularia sp. PCC 7116]|uniref:DUF4114 domain-containing protein n=1 Tax=Rivularia sp. PCC 7116 TaxID=373994 RepID=UPI00029EF849|nr:DUF4114 domain-containing protein [Rivularia sp. PCC 7116]AFY57672.1 uncharacterized protein with SCP/PR1 domains [Rivularia sp. PCC 7116]